MNTVIEATSAQAIRGLLLLIKAGSPILDTTYGNGCFWERGDDEFKVIGCDLSPLRARDVCASFLALPFQDNSFPVVVYDPPFHPYVNSYEEKRFKGMGSNEKELKTLFILGLSECVRVSSRHIIVKCQGFIHNHTPQWMPLWAIRICGEPFEWLIVTRKQKIISGRWVSNKSLRRNHADYLVFDIRGNKR